MELHYMHSDGRSGLRLGIASHRVSRWLAILFPITVGSVFGQSSLAPAPGFQGAPTIPAMGNVAPKPGQGSSQTFGPVNNPANRAAESDSVRASATAGGDSTTEATTVAPVATALNQMMRWGAVHVHLRASYQFLYATGIHSQPGNSEDTITHTLTPGMTVNFGPHLVADYSPSLRIYSEKGFHNTLDHALSAHGGISYGDWTFGLSQNLTITDEPMVETSSQVQQTDYGAALNASYSLNDKVSLGTAATVDLIYTQGGTNVFVGGPNAVPSALSDSQSYNVSETLDYKFNNRLSAGVLVLLGYTEQQDGFRSFEEQLNAHFDWRPGTKLSMTASIGLERRSFLDANASAAWSPIYSANVAYQLFDQTGLAIYASRSVNASIFDRQLSENTAVGMGIQQRLLGKVHLSLGFGYTEADYQSTSTPNLSTSRSDETLSYTAGLSVPFLKDFNFATFYQYSQNHSTQHGFSYDSNQLGVTLSWAY